MKIGIFSLAYIPFVGGAEIAVKEITDRLPDRDFVCFTYHFNPNWPMEDNIGNVRVIRLGKGGKNYYGKFSWKFFYIFRAWRAAEKMHKKQSFDVIWAMMASYGGFAALLFKLRHPEVPMLLTLQEGDSESHILLRVNIFYPLWRMIFKKADYIQTISNYLADFARRHGAKCPVEVVPNGVNLEKYNSMLGRSDLPNIKTGNFRRSDLQKLSIITTSRLVYKNGVDVLIKAMAELKNIHATRYTLKILGSGPDEQKLKNLAKELGVADGIEFLGHVEPEKIPNYLAQADIFARPSRSEGLGNSFLEAMAAGLPIIGTPVGGITDFIKDQVTGLFTKVDDPADLAEKIKLLMDDADLRQKISQNGQRLVFEKYSWDNVAEQISVIFNNLLT